MYSTYVWSLGFCRFSFLTLHRNQNTQNMEEGLVVKDLESQYILGEKARGLQHWVKMKPEYSDQTTNLDVIVLGAYYSEGKRRSGRIASFLIGVAEDMDIEEETPTKEETDEEEGEEALLMTPWANAPTTPRASFPSAATAGIVVKNKPPSSSQQMATPAIEQHRDKEAPKCFYTLGRCGSGISFAEWEELEKKLPLKPWKRGTVRLSHFKPWKPTKRDIPDFWVDPKESVILEVKCAEINESESFAAGLTLR